MSERELVRGCRAEGHPHTVRGHQGPKSMWPGPRPEPGQKNGGLSLNPWGRTVHVSWEDCRVSGSVHVKARRNWQSGCKGIVKKASLRSMTVK